MVQTPFQGRLNFLRTGSQKLRGVRTTRCGILKGVQSRRKTAEIVNGFGFGTGLHEGATAAQPMCRHHQNSFGWIFIKRLPAHLAQNLRKWIIHQRIHGAAMADEPNRLEYIHFSDSWKRGIPRWSAYLSFVVVKTPWPPQNSCQTYACAESKRAEVRQDPSTNLRDGFQKP